MSRRAAPPREKKNGWCTRVVTMKVAAVLLAGFSCGNSSITKLVSVNECR